MTSFLEMIMEVLNTGHPALIHFPIIGVLMGFVAASTALTLRSLKDLLNKTNRISFNEVLILEKFISKFEFTSYLSIIMGEIGLIIASTTGFYSAGSLEQAINTPLLEFKIRLTIYTFFLLLSPLFLKSYIGVVYKRDVFNDNPIIVAMAYTIPVLIASVLVAIIAGAGGKYVYGHSILEIFGLGWVFPS